MEEKVEKILSTPGNKNKYQYIILIFATLYWILGMSMTVSMPFLEQRPIVRYKDPETGARGVGPLEYKYCPRNFVIERKFEYSWVSEQNIYCSKIKTTLLGVLNTLGAIFGSIVYGPSSKYFGKKKTITYSNIILLILHILLLFIHNYGFYLFYLFLMQLCSQLGSIAILSYCSEIVDSKKRGIFCTIINSGYGLSGVIFTGIIWGTKTLVPVKIINVAFFVLLIPFFHFYVTNSPREMLFENVDEAIEILEKIAEKNGTTIDFHIQINSEENQRILRYFRRRINKNITEIEKMETKSEPLKYVKLLNEDKKSNVDYLSHNNIKVEMNNSSEESAEVSSILSINKQQFKPCDLWKFHSVRMPFVLISLSWTFIGGVYNSMSLAIKNVPMNPHLFSILFYAIEIVSNLVCSYIMENPICGRKNSTVFSSLICAFFTSLTTVVFQYELAVFILSLVAKFPLSIPYNILYVYCNEIYPTPFRSIGFGVNNAFDNIGTIAMQFLVEELESRPLNVVYSFMMMLGGLLFIPLEETVGKPVKETIKEIDEELMRENNLEEEQIELKEKSIKNENNDAKIIDEL